MVPPLLLSSPPHLSTKIKDLTRSPLASYQNFGSPVKWNSNLTFTVNQKPWERELGLMKLDNPKKSHEGGGERIRKLPDSSSVLLLGPRLTGWVRLVEWYIHHLVQFILTVQCTLCKNIKCAFYICMFNMQYVEIWLMRRFYRCVICNVTG